MLCLTNVLHRQVVKLKQIEHTLNEKRILQAVSFPFLVRLDYSFKVKLHPVPRAFWLAAVVVVAGLVGAESVLLYFLASQNTSSQFKHSTIHFKYKGHLKNMNDKGDQWQMSECFHLVFALWMKTIFFLALFLFHQDNSNLYMVMEYVPGGEMFSHLRRIGRFR